MDNTYNIYSLHNNQALDNTYNIIGKALWCVHYPNLDLTLPVTHRLVNPVFSDVAYGILHSVNSSVHTFDSTMIASEGSSGGLIIDIDGRVLGFHDSQHDDEDNENMLEGYLLCVFNSYDVPTAATTI